MKRKITQKKKIKIGIITSLFLVVFLFSFSIISILDKTGLEYEKISKSNFISDYIDKNEKLDIALSDLKISSNLKQEALNLGMVEVSSISYVSIASSDVALNR